MNKHILFISNLNNEEDVAKLTQALSQTKVDFEVLLQSKAVVVHGRNDIVYIAKTVIREAGYTIQ
jgi:hypothetical protein